MQSAFYAPPNSLQFPQPWNFSDTHLAVGYRALNSPRFCFKPLTLARSFRTRCRHDECSTGDKPQHSAAVRLPVVIRKSGRASQYIWDGSRLQLINVDGGNSSHSFNLDDGFGSLYKEIRLFIKNIFIPKNVSDHYMFYVKWKLLHRVFSSALQVIAFQAMFRAIGLGHSRSHGLGTISWFLKEGLGRLSRCIYTACFASAFDTNLKRVRFSTSVLFSLSIGVELLTPKFPQYFLLLASLANIVKQISLACYLSTASAIHRSFAVADNISEVSAKALLQSGCFDLLGIALAGLLISLCKNNQRLQAGLPIVAYPIFTAIDLFGTYQGLKHIHLQTVTKDRLEMIFTTWIDGGYVPSPAEVSEKEGVDFLCRNGKVSWRIRIGCLNLDSQLPKISLAMPSISYEDCYFICLDIFPIGFTTKRGILLCLREEASTTDIVTGLLQACFIRKSILSNRNIWEKKITKVIEEKSDEVCKEWHNLIEDGKQYSTQNVDFLIQQMSTLGWSVKNVLLTTNEQMRFSFL